MSRKQGPDGSMHDTRTGKMVEDLYPPALPRDGDVPFQWGDIDPSLLARAVDAVTERGHAISFAKNRASTAGCITILAGAERPKYWAEDLAEAERVLIALINLKPI